MMTIFEKAVPQNLEYLQLTPGNKNELNSFHRLTVWLTSTVANTFDQLPIYGYFHH